MTVENQCRVRNSSEYLFPPKDSVLQERVEPHQSKNPIMPPRTAFPVSHPLPQHDDTWGRRIAAWFGKRDNEDFRDFIHRNTGVYIYKFGEGVIPTGKYARAEIAAKIAAENPLSTKVTEHQIDAFAFAAAAAFGAFGCADPGRISRNPSPEQDASNLQHPDVAMAHIDAQEIHQDAATELPDILIGKDGGINTDSETQFPDTEILYPDAHVMQLDATPEDAAQDAGVVIDSGVIPDAGMCPSTDPQLVPICTCDPDGDGIITDRFPDRSFLSHLRSEFGRSQNADITVQDALRVSSLNLTATSRGVVQNISGVECFINLTYFFLNQPHSSSGITDVTPFASLVHLTDLTLMNNNISDITPFSGLINLNYLVLSRNPIADIGPLISNPGLGTGDTVYLQQNPQIPPSQIADLRAKGVNVIWP